MTVSLHNILKISTLLCLLLTTIPINSGSINNIGMGAMLIESDNAKNRTQQTPATQSTLNRIMMIAANGDDNGDDGNGDDGNGGDGPKDDGGGWDRIWDCSMLG